MQNIFIVRLDGVFHIDGLLNEKPRVCRRRRCAAPRPTSIFPFRFFFVVFVNAKWAVFAAFCCSIKAKCTMELRDRASSSNR